MGMGGGGEKSNFMKDTYFYNDATKNFFHNIVVLKMYSGKKWSKTTL